MPGVEGFDGAGRPLSAFGTARGACRRLPLAALQRPRGNLERAGVPRSVATKLTGHKTENVYPRYAIADEAALHEGVEKLAKMHQDGDKYRTAIPLKRARGTS